MISLMAQKIGIIDYGLSNLLSIYRAMQHVGAKTTVVSDPSEIANLDKVVLPGVGAFPDGMKLLKQRGMIEPLRRHAAQGKPFLGICLGMQMLLGTGFEMEETQGLNLIPGKVIPLPVIDSSGVASRIPHVGWEFIREPRTGVWCNTPLAGNADHQPYYFVHSYFAMPDNPDHAWAEADFGSLSFAAAVRNGVIFGTQFHPEKSGEQGLELLRQFVQLY